MLVSPGPAVTSANAFPLSLVALKYSVAIPAATSWTIGIQLNFVLKLSCACIIFPPDKKKQCVYPRFLSHNAI